MTTSIRYVGLAVLVVSLLLGSDAFSVVSQGTRSHQCSSTQLDASYDNSNGSLISRTDFVSSTLLSLTTLLVDIPSALASDADDEAITTTRQTITPCPVVSSGKPNNCVSTASVKQVDLYSPPWTYEVSADEAMARLKGVIASDSSLKVEEEVLPSYLRVTSNRGPLNVTDQVEFFVNANDKVVTFKSQELGEPTVSDFGANRKRLETLRKRAGVFGIMGDGMTADSVGNRGMGPLQQLKAFYGLQSGGGYEEVFENE